MDANFCVYLMIMTYKTTRLQLDFPKYETIGLKINMNTPFLKLFQVLKGHKYDFLKKSTLF